MNTKDEDLNAAYHEVVQIRAARLRQTPEAVRENLLPEARSIAAWRSTAKATGLSVQQLLERRIQDKSGSLYPTPLCLTPDEVSATHSIGALSSERQEHVRRCAGCTNLIGMLNRVPPLVHPQDDDPETALCELIMDALHSSHHEHV